MGFPFGCGEDFWVIGEEVIHRYIYKSPSIEPREWGKYFFSLYNSGVGVGKRINSPVPADAVLYAFGQEVAVSVSDIVVQELPYELLLRFIEVRMC